MLEGSGPCSEEPGNSDPDHDSFVFDVNLYTYVSNNPLMQIDVFGLCEEACSMRSMFESRMETSDRWAESNRGAREFDPIDTAKAIAAVGHAGVDFCLMSLQDMQTAALLIGSGDLDVTPDERM